MKKKWMIFLLAGTILISVVNGQAAGAAGEAAGEEPRVLLTPSLKDILGSTHTSGRYYFGEEDFLNEGAERMLALGSSNIKVWLSSKPKDSYPYNSEWPTDIGSPTGPKSMLDILKLPYYQELLDKPFRTIVFEAIEFGPAKSNGSVELTTTWKDGLSQAERESVQKQFYELTKYLLERFQHSGRTFILQNWEGDNALRAWETPTAELPTAIQGMIDWSNARQDGIYQAREEVGTEGVTVAGALEVTRIPAGGESFDHQLVVQEVVPYTHMDLYSLSTWGTRLPGEEKELLAKLAYFKEKAPDSALFSADNLMLGEFGAYETTYNRPQSFPQNNYEATLSPGADGDFNETTGAAQWVASRKQLEYGLQMGIRYALYWELYDNGLKDGITLDSLSTDARGYKVARMDQLRGVWLVRQDGSYTPTWHYFANLYNPKSITDYLNDWSRTFSRTSNLSFATDQANSRAEGDTSRAVNLSGQDGYLVYRLDQPISDFSVKVLYRKPYNGSIDFYSSIDGNEWSKVVTEHTSGTPTADGWNSGFVRSRDVADGSRHLKVVLKGHPGVDLELSGVQINSAASAGDPNNKYYNPVELTGINLGGKPIQSWNSIMLLKYPYNDTVLQPKLEFDPAVIGYKVFLPADTREAPSIEPVVNNPDLHVEVTPPAAVPGIGTVKVSSKDKSHSITYRVEFARSVTARLTSEDQVQTGDTFQVDVGLTQVARAIQAQDITVHYDQDVLEYVDAASYSSGKAITEQDRSHAGTLRIMLAGLGSDQAVRADEEKLLRLAFRAKKNARTTITLGGAKLAESNGMEWTAGLVGKTILIRDRIPDDETTDHAGEEIPRGNNAGAQTGTAGKGPQISDVGDRKTAIWKVEPAELEKALTAGTDRITLPVSGVVDEAVAELPVAALFQLANHSGLKFIDMVTDLGTYVLPVQAIDFERIQAVLGGPFSDATVEVRIGKADPAVVKQVQASVGQHGQLAAPIVDFEVHITGNGQRVPIEDFGRYYASRMIALDTADLDPAHATGIHVAQDGTIRFIPTIFRKEGNRWIGELKSTTNSMYSVLRGSVTFDDVAGHWSMRDVEMLASKRLVNGVSEREFAPERSVTRAEATALIVRGLGLMKTNKAPTQYRDVLPQDWYAGYVETASGAGLISGYEDGTFRPTASVSREELSVIMHSAMRWLGKGTSPIDAKETLSAFEDRNELPEWSIEAVARMVEAGIANGRGVSSFAGKEIVTRAEAAVMLKRFLKKVDFMN
ncbi:MAG: hypothetical protein K0Q73_1334 [Paenibacillus sp.]|nr:hypothetical protein [Paenibacillus sp.]